MDPKANEWLHLGLRGLHIVAAVMWIGSSLFFMWLDSHLEKPRQEKEGLEGELWMVHSGGFYEVQKKFVSPEELPKTLHWFKWEAAFTWISGICLLVIVYWTGGALIDPSVASLSVGAGIGISLGVIVVSWAIYDAAWNSPLGKGQGVGAIVVTAGLIVGAAILFSRTLAPRAAYIHVGAMMGTWMVANVWMRIIPAQRVMVEAAREGKRPDPTPGHRAKQRSRQNTYFTYPVIITMISNHFPTATYGSGKIAWAILLAMFVVTAAVRHYQIVKEGSPKILLGAIVIAFGAAHMLGRRAKSPPPSSADVTTPGMVVATTAAAGGPTAIAPSVDTTEVGSIEGVTKLDGAAPPPVEIKVPGECAAQGPVYDGKVIAKDGKLGNVFVWIRDIAWTEPPGKAPEVQIDQRSCVYVPRVVGVQVGHPLAFVNGDDTLHNVHAEGEQGFNFAITGKQAPKVVRTFSEPAQMIHVKCDVHPWMTAWVGVLPHPYFATTPLDGSFKLTNVPPGQYVVAAWHEVYGTQDQTVTVAPKSAASIAFTFKAP